MRPRSLSDLYKGICGCVLLIAFAANINAREFSFSGTTLDLQEVTTNVDVYFSAMRLNRAVNQWNVDVTLSNKVGQVISGPIVLLVDSFTGTAGPLGADGTSSNAAYYDFSSQLSQGTLSSGTKSASRTIALGYTVGGSPKIVTRIYAGAAIGGQAIGFTRSLNDAGQPLPSVMIQETDPDGSTTNVVTEGELGVVTVGKLPGNYIWKFSLDGYFPAWRIGTLFSNSVQVIPYPRLTPRNSQTFPVSPLIGGGATNKGVQILFPGGAVSQNAAVAITLLHGQSLPLLLPQGWSPLQAFWLESTPEPVQPFNASLAPWGPIKPSESAALVKFDSATLTWRVLQLVTGNDTNAVNVILSGTGAYALVVPDAAPIAPPAAVAGLALSPSTAPAPSPFNLVAAGQVTPSTSAASTVPELVTGIADVAVTNLAGNLPSGTLLRGQFSEHYLLQDGTTRVPPMFDNFVVGYQRPGTRTDTVHARFPMRPLLLFSGEILNQGVVHADLGAPGAFIGGLIGTNGGLVASGNVRLIAGPGVTTGQNLIQLQNLDPTNFTDLVGTNFTIAGAFEVGLTGVVPGRDLALQITGASSNATFVLARVIERSGLFGLEPRERLHSDANGNLVNDEPLSGDRLPGLTVAGLYVLLQVQPQQGLVAGVAKNSNGQAAGGLPVTITGQPWLTFSAADGSFKILAPSGSGTVSVSDLATGDTGTQGITIPANLTEVNTTVGSVVTGLRVNSVTPADTATNVPAVTSIVINFNRAINPATIIGSAIQLLGAGNQPVAASVSLNLANTAVTLLPASSLDAGTTFTISISTNVADTIGRTLSGQNQFTFSTVPVSVRDLAAQLIIYGPGSTNLTTNILADIPGYVPGSNSIVVVHGTPGSSDPGVPVIVANEGSGETTTVLAKSDGSFTTYVAGQEQDFISATFINLNNTRTYMPVTRQVFDDGSVGLYPQGGVVQAQGDGGAVQITVPPNAIPTKTIFKLASINVDELATQLGGVLPTNSTVAGAALNLHIEGAIPTQPLQVRFPVDLTALGYPTNEAPTNVAAVLALVQSNQDVTTFEVKDQLLFTPQTNSSQLRAHSLIHPNGSGDNGQLAAGFLDSSIGLVVPLLGPVGLAAQIGFNQVLVPLLFGPRPVVIKGKAAAVPYDLATAIDTAGIFNQIANLQTGNENIDVPFQLAQLMNLVPTGSFGTVQGTVGGILSVANTAFQQAEIAASKPLSGAFITVSLNGGPLVNQPGHLYPGMVYATSGQDGYYLTVAPAAGASYIVTCTHPLFAEVKSVPVNPISLVPGQQGQLSLAGAVFDNFFFQIPTESQTQPTVNIANLPVQPGATEPCQLIVNASQPAAQPNIGVKIVSVGTNNLLTGVVETNAQCTISNIVKTPAGNTLKWTATILANKPVLVKFLVTVQGQNGDQDAMIPYQIAFAGPTPVAPLQNIPKPDTNDIHGPLVSETQPTQNSFVGDDGQITITFNKPIDATVTNRLGGILLSASGNSSATIPSPIVRLSGNQQSITLQYPGLTPGATYQLTLSAQSIQDLAGQPFDQLPSTPTSDSFTMTFRTPASQTAALPGLLNGKGSVISGNRLYALDQAPQDNYLDVYDISVPLKPRLLSQTHLFGLPRDLTVIPQYNYVRSIHDTVQSNDLVVVVGGDLDSIINTNQGTDVTVPGQYLWVIAAGDGTSPQIIASPIVSYRVGSAVTKVRWSPPYLIYQEFGADIQMLGFVHLQELLIGWGSTFNERLGFPDAAHRNDTNRGKDLNGDGDYVDPGESLPFPDANPPEFYGKHQSYVLQNTTQKILDYSVTGGGAIVGVTLGTGLGYDGNGVPSLGLPAMYRTFVSGGLPLNIGTPTDSRMPFPGAYPRFVTIFDDLPITLNGARTTIAAALVSLEPDSDGTQKLAVVDITLPLTPRLVSKIPIPDSLLGGPIESVNFSASGYLEVAGAQNIVLLSPSSLGISNAPAGQLNPAIVGLIPNASSGTRSLGSTDYGVHSVADGARGVVVQSAPQMSFVSFPTFNGLVDPTTLVSQSDSNLNVLFSKMQPTLGLAPARFHPQTTLFLNSDLEPTPNPALHYYVTVTAPGAAGETIEVGMESLNQSGRPLANLGQGFAPVRALSDATQAAVGQTPRPCGAAIHSLKAYRMSKDPHSDYYNRYLSKPFALITESVSSEDLFRLTTEGVPREILFSGAELRAFIEPDQADNPDTSPVLGPFAAQIDARSKMIYPICSVTGFTVNRDYIVGDNPPPPGGATPMEDTYGTIQSHSGELRTSDIDLSLPSPRMALSITRSIGNQDTYEGPFGVGWDFNYNQRLTVLDPLTFPAGLQMTLIVRDTAADSEIASSQDVLFNDGEGEVFHYRWVSTNPPPEYASDPLVADFDYVDLVSDYYLPQPGTFDLLVKFKDGRFERLTPSGVRYRYTSEGRLESIIDRYPKNRHDLQYQHGLLTRIDDHSVSTPRYIEFGYYRQQSTDPDFTGGLDMDSSNPYLAGKICRLRDYTGRDVLFNYDDQGFLTNRADIPVNGDNGGFAGRASTFYTYNNCRLVGVTGKKTGTPIISAVTTVNSKGKSVTQSTTGSQGNNQLSIPPENTAQNVGDETTSVTMADGSKVTRTYDKMGNVTKTTVTGAGATAATEVNTDNVDGLTVYTLHPEGNSETTVYDTGNANFRSHGNVLSMTVDPGPRGGTGYTMKSHYDPRYNLPSGDQTDANGNTIKYTLTSDNRQVGTIDYGGVGTKTATYNDNGQLVHGVDENGVENSLDIDSSTGFLKSQTTGNLTYTSGYDGSVASQLGRQASITPPTGSPTTFVYDNRLEVIQTSRGALVTKSAYDELGRPIYHQSLVGDGKQLISTMGYDDKGFVTNSTTDGVEVNGSIQSYTSAFKPDERSRVKEIHHPNGTVQTLDYDARGNVTRMQLGDYIEEYGYDLNNNMITLKQGGDIVRTIEYDGLDRAKNVVQKTGTQDYTDSSTFYPDGQLLTETLTDPQFGVLKEMTYDQIDALGRHTIVKTHGNVISPQYTYDYHALSSSISGPRMSTSTTWDTAGNPIGSVDPNQTVTIHRDENGRIHQTDEQQDGATYSQIFTYDDLDHKKTVSDLLATKFTYDSRADGNFTKVTDARGNSTILEHTSLGELLRKQRSDGMEVDYRHDTQRQVVYQGDPGAGFKYGFDDSFRMTNSSLRNGAGMSYNQFDPRSMPLSISLPGGGTETFQYDLQRRMTQRKANYQGTSVQENYVYDGMDRIRTETYTANGGPVNTATFNYDKSGVLLGSQFQEDGATFGTTNGFYADGAANSITYSSGTQVNLTRDVTGRLTGVSDTNGNIINALSWQGNNEPKLVQLGSTMQVAYQYDLRGRVTGSRFTRVSDGAVLAHMRYQYDAANNLQIREYVHRGGKGDVFGYDTAERVSTAQVSMLITNAAGFGPKLYERDYNYHLSGLDYLTSVAFSGFASNAPPFASNWPDHDDFLLPTSVDGFGRLADPLGNVAKTQLWVRDAGASAPHQVTATLQHDGLGRLVQVTRADNVTIQYQYQPGGLRYSKKVFQGASLVQYSAYVYDSGSRLIEEYDRTGAQPVLIARYFYASGDSPVAADLPGSGGGGSLQRYYFLRDVAMSVVAVADAAGNVVERNWYDTFGQPLIERRDTKPPGISSVRADASGGLLIVLSESVQSPWTDPGPGSSIVPFPNNVSAALSVFDNGTNAALTGTLTLVPSLAGFRPNSVLRFTPDQTSTNSLTLTLAGGTLSDEWGNHNVQQTVTITNTQAQGAVLYQAQVNADTSATQLARSDVGSAMLFDGQYFDYDTGLIYLKARFYDPFSGMFMEPDPLGYEDSVNHYAGMGNNPVSARDPSGLRNENISHAQYHGYLQSEGHNYSAHEISLISRVHEKLTGLGMGDLEIAAHVRVMLREYVQNNVRWEIGIRTFSLPKERILRVDEGYQGKEEKVKDKSNEKALVTYEKTGEVFTSDLDGLYAKRNGQIASIQELTKFQAAVNEEVARLQGGWRELNDSVGQHSEPTVGGIQKVYQHGFSLNIPQEHGTPHALSPGGTFGMHAIDEINDKMKKGIGGAFSFTFDEKEIHVEEHVNVDAMLQEHETYYRNVLFNPLAIGRGFSPRLYLQRGLQFLRDGRIPQTLYPKPFYIKNGVE